MWFAGTFHKCRLVAAFMGGSIDTLAARSYAQGMEICTRLEQFDPPTRGVVVSIGNFDGVHRGHGEIIGTARGVAERLGVPCVVMTFHPHPLAVLAPERAPALLTTLGEKLRLLEHNGVDSAIVLRTDSGLLTQAADDFLARLVAHVRPRAIVEGPDFSFGRGRYGTIDTLRAHADRWGYEVHIVGAVHCEELSTHPTISSSSIRQALRDGRVDEANTMLGRAYRVVGVTGEGHHRGVGLGFPTANLDDIPHLLPQEAVYAAIAQLEDGGLHPAAVNVGAQPTFDQAQPRVEAFLLDFSGELRGCRLGLHFLKRLREQVRFEGPQRLVEQIARDVAATQAAAEKPGPVAVIPL